ncbi:MAG: uncharacterized protein A8A55_0371 [Amphiamblys sp. WSBS2006]|nr:MAG: uncharacterized protein A8A55_0371 [Amphiamblys sp. WSBS2006]
MFQGELGTPLRTAEEFDGILARIYTQDKAAEEQKKRLDETEGLLSGLVQKQDVAVHSLFSNTLEKQARIEARVLELTRKMTVLRRQGYPLSPQEQASFLRVRKLKQKVSGGCYREKTASILGLLGDRDPTETPLSILAGCIPENMAEAQTTLKLLSTQNTALKELLASVKEDLRCLAIVTSDIK